MMHKVLSVLGLLFCFSAVAQKSRVVLSASKTKIEVGETIAFKVESNIEGSFQIDNIPSSFVNGGGINGGVNYQMDYNTGNLLVIYSYAETGAFTKPARGSTAARGFTRSCLPRVFASDGTRWRV